jgi:hypothetical protein
LRLLRRFVVVLVVIEVVYLIAGNVILNTSIGPSLVNRKPEKVQGEWASAWTVLPGLVTVHEPKFRGQSRGWQWYAEADKVTAFAHLTPLPWKRVVGRWARAEGLSLWMRRRREEPLPVEEAAWVPPIPGLTNPPDPNPEVLYPPNPDSKPWQITLDHVELVDAREIWIENIHLTGSGTGDGYGLAVETKGGPISGERVALMFGEGSLQVGEWDLGTELELSLDVEVEPFRGKGITFYELMAGVTGAVSLAGSVPDLGVLGPMLGGLPVSIGGHGDTHMSFELDHGRIRPGSELQVNGEALEATYLDYVARGEGTIEGHVEAGETEPMAELLFKLDDFSLGWMNDPPYVKGSGFRMVATSPSPDLARDGIHPEAYVVVDLPPSTITDFAQFNRYLPSGLGMAFVEGSAQVSSHFEFTAADKSVKGRIGFNAPHVVADFAKARIAGTIQLETILAKGDLETRSFRGERTTLELKGIDLRGSDGQVKVSDWWARLHLSGGRLELKTVPVIKGKARLELRDSSPLGVILGERNKKLAWLANALEVKDVTAVTEVSGTKDVLHVRELELDGDKLKLRSDVTLIDGKAVGIFFTKFRKARVGAELKGGERDWKIIRAQKWYDEQLELRRRQRGK